MENTKICKKCGRELPLECFGKCKSSKDGLQAYCKACQKQYYTANREHMLERQKQYNADNAERLKQYRASHKEDKAEYMKRWRAENSEYMKQYDAERYATIERYAYTIRYTNLRNDRKYGRCSKDEDILPPLDYYIWAIQQRDFYDGKQYHWSEMGVDRIDNSKPHTIDNIVPCSTAHNVQRQKMPFEEFCELMRKETTSINGKEVFETIN